MSDSDSLDEAFLLSMPGYGDDIKPVELKLNDAGDVVRIDLNLQYEIDCKGGNWRMAADAIARGPALKDITLRYHEGGLGSNRKALAAVFGRERTRPCALDRFDAVMLNLGPEDLAIMLPLLKSTPAIKQLSLFRNQLGDRGTELLSEVLSHTRVEYLGLRKNEMSGRGLGQLLSAEHSKHLLTIDLECNAIGARGLDAICRFLQRDDTAMLNLNFDFVDQNQFRTVLESISPRSNLSGLLESADGEIEAADDIADKESIASMSQMLKNVICNTDTIESLCKSNHQLIWVGPCTCHMMESDPMLKKAITINYQSEHGASIASIIRSKLRAFYFQGQFDVQPFIDMDVALMPFVLALVTRTERVFSMENNDEGDSSDDEREIVTYDGWFSELAGGKCFTVVEGDLGSVYRLVRNCHLPKMFTFPSSQSRIQNYEIRISSLMEENARLTAENEELRSQFGRPFKKRASR